ncbi:hypothetical protein ACFQU2_11750 [Siccirubricoccus deserti]
MSAAATPAIDAVAYRARQRAWLAENLPPHWRADAVDYRPPSLDEAKAWKRPCTARDSGASPGRATMAAMG